MRTTSVVQMSSVVVMALATGCAAPAEPPDEAGGDDTAEPRTENAATHEMGTLQVGDLSMRVAEQGSGPLVLLLHGFPES